MKTEPVVSVSNGQLPKKTRSKRTDVYGQMDFMSVMDSVSPPGKSSDDISSKASSASGSGASGITETKESISTARAAGASSSSQSLAYQKLTGTAKTGDRDTKKTDNRKEAAKSSQTEDATSDQTQTIDRSRTVARKKDTADQVKDKNTKTAGPETEDDKVERSEAANDLISDILNTISKDLGVSKDDITDAMDKLGLSFADLSIPSNTAELYTELTGSDSGSLLTSDNFMSLLDDLQDIFSGVDDELMSQLTPVTDEEAENFSDLLSGQQPTDETVDQTEVTVVSVTTEETTVTVSAETASTVDSANQIQTTDTSSDQTVNGTITNTTQQAASTEQDTTDNSSDMFGKGDGQKSTADQVNVNAATAANAQASSETEVTDFISTIQKYTDINTDDLISQIVDKAKQTLSSRVSSLEMELHPQSLGKIFLQVTEKSGDVTAHLYAQNEAVKHALENRLADLTEDLNRQGVRVNEVTISVEPHAFDENLEKNMSNQFGNNPNSGTQSGTFEGEASSRGSRSRSTIDLRNGAVSDDMTSDEALEASIMQDNGNTVSYRI
ncbi:MAG: flagellar hook-length control protein FliK [Lachnospiraceae bacterium]|nr:flagellar hook-length control protein FliK [Lachnospiraceae bacterium]MDY4164923.1 flagellar hook-length control protein FliK [Lachnospiraceae bacterium]